MVNPQARGKSRARRPTARCTHRNGALIPCGHGQRDRCGEPVGQHSRPRQSPVGLSSPKAIDRRYPQARSAPSTDFSTTPEGGDHADGPCSNPSPRRRGGTPAPVHPSRSRSTRGSTRAGALGYSGTCRRHPRADQPTLARPCAGTAHHSPRVRGADPTLVAGASRGRSGRDEGGPDCGSGLRSSCVRRESRRSRRHQH